MGFISRLSLHSKKETPAFCGIVNITVLGVKIKRGLVHILIIFRGMSMFSHIYGKLSPRP